MRNLMRFCMNTTVILDMMLCVRAHVCVSVREREKERKLLGFCCTVVETFTSLGCYAA